MKTRTMLVFLLAFMMLVPPVFSVYEETTTSTRTKTESAGDLQVMLTRYEPFPAQPGKYLDVWFTIQNRGTNDVSGAEFELVPKYPFSLHPDEESKRVIGKIIPFQSVLMKYRVRLDDAAVLGSNDLNYQFHEKDYLTWKEGIVEVYVQPRDLNLAVEGITVAPEKIGPGEKGRITLTLKNYGESVAENIKAKLLLEGSTMPLVAYNSVGERRVSQILPGKEKEVVFDVMALSDADSKVYKVPLELEYFDGVGKRYNLSNVFAVPVSTDPELYFIIDGTTILSEGSPGEITVKAVNPGTSDVKFLDVTLLPSDDYELLSADRVYVGKVDSDDYETADFKVLLKNSKNSAFDIKIKAEYQDATNEQFASEETLRVSFAENKYAAGNGGGLSKLFFAVLVIGAVYFIYRRWKKKHEKSKK